MDIPSLFVYPCVIFFSFVSFHESFLTGNLKKHIIRRWLAIGHSCPEGEERFVFIPLLLSMAILHSTLYWIIYLIHYMYKNLQYLFQIPFYYQWPIYILLCIDLIHHRIILYVSYIYQGCISCGILVSGIRSHGVSSEHMENVEMFSCSPTKVRSDSQRT